MPFSESQTPVAFFPMNGMISMLFYFLLLRLLIGEDVRVTSIEDGHGGRPERLTAGVAEVNLSRGEK